MKLSLTLFLALSVPPVFAQGTLNLSQDLVRLGIASANMTPNQLGQDTGPLFRTAVQYAQSHQISNLIADPGSYYFLSATAGCHAQIPSNLTVDFQGSDLYFADLASSALCPNGSNITLQNFTIDYLKLPYTQVLITAVDTANQQISFSVRPGWQKPTVLSALSTAPNPFSLSIFRGGRLNVALLLLTAVTDNKATLPPFGPYGSPADYAAVFAQIRPGDIAALQLSIFNSGVLGVCSTCTFRNIRIYSGRSGVYVWGQSDVSDRVYIMPRPGTDRLLSTFNDGIHLVETGPNNVIRLSRVIRNGDDGFSPNSPKFGIVTKQLDNRTLQVQGSPGGEDVATFFVAGSLPNGSTLEFQRKVDGVILGQANIASQTTPIPVTGVLPNGGTGPTNQVNLTFDRDLPSGLEGNFLYSPNASQRGGVSIERSTVQQQVSGSGFQLYGLVNSSVKGNYVSRSAWTGVWINSNTYPAYAAAPPSQNVTISGNVIDRPNNWLTKWIDDAQFGGIQALGWLADTTPMKVSPMQNITISNNFVADPRRSGIWMGNTTGGTVSGNYLFNPNNDPAPLTSSQQPYRNQFLQPLVVDASQNVATNSNTIDKTSGRMWVTDTQSRELAAYAPGSTIRLNAYNLGKLASPSFTLTDADGVVMAAAVQNTSSHVIDVLLPAAVGLGGAYLTLTSGGTKYFGTLFVDSQDNIPAVNDCTYEISPSATLLSGEAASVPVLVVTQAACAYQILTADSFVSPGPGATGTAVVSAAFAANPGAPRTTTIEIAGQPITLTQGLALFTNKNSASYALGTVAPDMIAFGETLNIAAGLVVAPDGPWPATLGGAHLDITDSQGQTRAAPIYFVTSTAMSYLVPAGTALGTAMAILTTSTGATVTGMFTVERVVPGLFAANSTGSGVAAGLAIRVAPGGAQTTSYLFDLSSRDLPVNVDLTVPGDVYLSLYGTGFRGATGPATATVGGVNVPVLGFAAVPVYQGEDVVNIGPLPKTLGSGIKNIVLTFASKVANTVTVGIR